MLLSRIGFNTAVGESIRPRVWSSRGTPCEQAGLGTYFPFGGAKDSFFGDLKAHGRDAFEFYTDKKVTISRWF